VPSNCDFDPILSDIYDAIAAIGQGGDETDLSGILGQLADLAQQIADLNRRFRALGDVASQLRRLDRRIDAIAAIAGQVAQLLALEGRVRANTAGVESVRNLAIAGDRYLQGQINQLRRRPGVPGPQGPPGPRGQRGEDGRDGARGPRGERGERGRDGARGPRGQRGERGREGARGRRGERGERGRDGARGAKGERGERGRDGARGAKGERGERGRDGARGAKGERGERGRDGARGAKGERGERGANGSRGARGARGARGPRGPKGPQGPRGPRGVRGPKGRDGKDVNSGIVAQILAMLGRLLPLLRVFDRLDQLNDVLELINRILEILDFFRDDPASGPGDCESNCKWKQEEIDAITVQAEELHRTVFAGVVDSSDVPDQGFRTMLLDGFESRDSNGNPIFVDSTYNDVKDLLKDVDTIKNNAPVYATPIHTYHDRVQFKPQIVLLFRERVVSDLRDRPIESQVGFRLMGGFLDPCSMAERIDNVFHRDYVIARGTYKCAYWDPDRGYRMNCLVADPSEAERLFRDVLSLQGHSFDSERFSINRMPYRQFNSDPDAGRRERPTGYVHLLFAELKIWQQKDKVLVDRSGRRKSILTDGTC
jgi:hypothetical protein